MRKALYGNDASRNQCDQRGGAHDHTRRVVVLNTPDASQYGQHRCDSAECQGGVAGAGCFVRGQLGGTCVAKHYVFLLGGLWVCTIKRYIKQKVNSFAVHNRVVY